MTQLLRSVDSDFEEVRRCSGPLPDGSCRRLTQGEMLPCAGLALAAERSALGAPQSYAVSGRATQCPVSLAAALAVASDAPFDLACWRPERDARDLGRGFRRVADDPHRHPAVIAPDAA